MRQSSQTIERRRRRKKKLTRTSHCRMRNTHFKSNNTDYGHRTLLNCLANIKC